MRGENIGIGSSTGTISGHWQPAVVLVDHGKGMVLIDGLVQFRWVTFTSTNKAEYLPLYGLTKDRKGHRAMARRRSGKNDEDMLRWLHRKMM